MRFRTRLIITITVTTLATLGGATIAISTVVNRSQERQLDDALVAEAHEEAREASEIGGDKLAISDRPGPYANDVGPLTKYGVIYSKDAEVLASTPTFAGACAIPELWKLAHARERPFNLWCGAEHLRGVLVPLPRRLDTTLLLAAPRTDLDGDAAFLARAIAIAFVVSVFWALLLSFWLVRRLMRDHSAIAVVAERVADGDLTARIHHLSMDDEMAQLARSIDTMIDRLAAIVKSQERFVANAAHELQSPITALYTDLQQIIRRPRSPEEYQAGVKSALEATRQLETLAQDLLVLIRSSHEGEPMTTVSIPDVIDEVIERIKPAAHQKDVLLAIQIEECAITGQRGGLMRLLRNVLENAVAHTPRGGRVSLQMAIAPTSVEVHVMDEGPGVACEDRERIFEPFYRAASAAMISPEGSGLGLGIARNIARAHGGDVWLSEAPRTTGAEFIIFLPMAVATESR